MKTQIIEELQHKELFKQVFNKITTYKSNILKLENDSIKFKALSLLDEITNKALNDFDFCIESNKSINNTIQLKKLLSKCSYNESNINDFNAFCLLDNEILNFKHFA